MSLIDVFGNSARKNPDRPALVVEDQSFSYGDLWSSATRVAGAVQELAPSSTLCGVLGAGTAHAFEGILGILLSGRGYVPLNPSFPIARLHYMIEAAELDLLIVDRSGRACLAELLLGCDRKLCIVFPDAGSEELVRWKRDYPEHYFVGIDNPAFETGSAAPSPQVDPSSISYLMFTSGSTGKPKGVMISHENILHYLGVMREIYDFSPADRFSQMFDLTFDLSLFDMFVCWGAGAALYVVPQSARMAPARFIRKSELTVWFSVPAVAGMMNQLKMLKPDNFPSLRYSLFCGEALPASVTQLWQSAAPNARIDNLYGPTELTVACTMYSWDPARSPAASENGVVPIGRPFPGLEAALVDERLNPVASGKSGELCVRGPQSALGYWKNEMLTVERFVAMPWFDGPDNRWYRTGDVVRRNSDDDFIFVGRVDNQVKILGYRVELGEIEAHLREHGRTDFGIAIPWPPNESGASGVVACLAGSDVPDLDILAACKQGLPDYMVPNRIFRLDRMPLNSNGKIDRGALLRWVKEQDVQPR